MKKFLSLALALTMALTLAACGGKTDTPPADTNDGSTAGQTGGKLVVYSALNEDNTKGRHSGRRLCGPVWLFGHRRCF